MNIAQAVRIGILILGGLEQAFANQDVDEVGNDDRAARIIGDAIRELNIYLAELKSNNAKN